MRPALYIAILISCLPSLGYAIDTIEIKRANADIAEAISEYKRPFSKSYVDELDVGRSLSLGQVVLHGNSSETYRVKLQLETSMSITAEGPHLDLTDWKHCTTAWFDLKKVTDNSFVLPNFDAITLDCFPVVSLEEIKAEVAKRGGEEWISVLEGANWPSSYSPIEISLSHARIKIEKLVDAQWIDVTTIQFAIPMGC